MTNLGVPAHNPHVIRFAKFVLVLALTTGCAIAPTARVVRAQVEIDAATGAGADRYAIYEITKAREYLHKAREELGYAEYQTATHYADAAVENGERAKTLSRDHPVESAALPPAPPSSPPPASVQQTPPPIIVPATSASPK